MHIDIHKDVSIGSMTSFKVGGLSNLYAIAKSVDELARLIRYAIENNLKTFYLGGGSNILVSDNGFEGLTIRVEIKGYRQRCDNTKNSRTVIIGAGEPWDNVVKRYVKRNFSGIECLSGIPGNVGAAAIQNIGAYGQQLSDTLLEVHAVNVNTGQEVKIPANECEFGYRTSAFKTDKSKRNVITAIKLRLVHGGPPNTSYPELLNRLALMNISSLMGIRKMVLKIRNEKGMLYNDGNRSESGFESYNSAGSFFINPVVDDELFQTIKRKITRHVDDRNWYWELDNGKVKISAAFLIDEAGFHKGSQSGSVAISPKHNLSIINLGGATANDVIKLARKIQEKVKDIFKVILEVEVEPVGFPLYPFLTNNPEKGKITNGGHYIA